MALLPFVDEDRLHKVLEFVSVHPLLLPGRRHHGLSFGKRYGGILWELSVSNVFVVDISFADVGRFS